MCSPTSVREDLSSRRLNLSDDLWLMVLNILAEDNYQHLMSFAAVCRRFSQLAAANYIWYKSFRAVYPSYIRSISYRDVDQQPPDWKKKLAVAVNCVKKWEVVDKQTRGPPSPIVRTDSGFEEMEFNALPHLDQPQKSTSSWTTVVPPKTVPAACSNCDAFTYASIQADSKLYHPDGSTTPSANVLVGLTMVPAPSSSERTPNTDSQSTIVFLDALSGTVQGNASFASSGPAPPVLRYLDTGRDLFVLAHERDQRWKELAFHRLSGCFEPCDSTTSHPVAVSTLTIPDDLECYSIEPYPRNLRHLPRCSLASPPVNLLNPTETLIILALSDTDEGVVLVHDYSTSSFVARKHYGTEVYSITSGEPYESIIITGHADHCVRLWDFETCAPLLVVRAPESIGRPVLGSAFLDEPESWNSVGRPWMKPRGLHLVSFTDWTEGYQDGSGNHLQQHPQQGRLMKPAGDFVVWDLTQHVARARTRLLNANGRTVSLPPLEIDASTIMVRHKVAMDDGDAVATFYMCWPVLVVLTMAWVVIVVECETGRVICKVPLGGCESDSIPGDDAIYGLNVGPAGELLVSTKKGVVRLG